VDWKRFLLRFYLVGFPAIRFFGTEGEYNMLVMDRLGQSLEELFAQCNRQFSLKTILMLAEQMVKIVVVCSVFIDFFLVASS
jgi:hypothetical protein